MILENTVLPHSLTLEQAIIAGLMSDTEFEIFDDVAAMVTAKDFYAKKHGLLFSTIYDLFKSGSPADALSVFEKLKNGDMLERIGGEAYLMQILRDSPATIANILHYAQKIKYFSVCRDLIKTCHEVIENTKEHQGRPLSEILDFAESRIFQTKDALDLKSGEPKLIREVSKKVVNDIEQRFENGGEITGLTTGFYDLDELTLGLQKKELVIIAGCPSMGKSTFAFNIAENAMIKQIEKGDAMSAGIIFSMEMSDNALVEKTIASIGKVQSHNMRKGDIQDDDWPKITSAISKFSGWPFYIDDTSAITITEIRAKARRIKKKHGAISFVIVDYLQLMGSTEKGFSRENEVATISRSLKALAKELDCPVVALAQLNRGIAARANKRPVMSDLRESGQIEQDADLIMLVYRDEYYNIDSTDKGTAEIIVAKQRNGAVGTVRLGTDLSRSKFLNLVKNDYK